MKIAILRKCLQKRFLLAALLFAGIFSAVSGVAYAHNTHSYISPGVQALTTFYRHNNIVDTWTCDSDYRLKVRSEFNSVTGTNVDYQRMVLTPTIYEGSVTGGQIRIGNYQNQRMRTYTGIAGSSLSSGTAYPTLTYNVDVPFASNNQLIVTTYSSGSLNFDHCSNVDYQHVYPDED